MAYAPIETYFNTGDGSIIGRFIEADAGRVFEYSENNDGVFEEYPHKIWVGKPIVASNGLTLDSGFRYGKVLNTRCYICLDEDEYGKPVADKWFFKQKTHHRYTGDARYTIVA
jgi:hypothetical protein